MPPFVTKIVICVLWLAAIATGAVVLSKYQNSDGEIGSVPQHWPSSAPVSRSPGKDTLLLFAHPKCPCTRATVEELNRLLARCSRPVTTHAFFFKPADCAEEWSQTSLRLSAAAIPGVVVHDDLDGEISSQFGAKTSGSVLLYDSNGRLLFKGGITASRGHAGDNAGSDAIVSLLERKQTELSQTRVYGCALATPRSGSTNESICGK
jgi:hypothetical protein